MIQKIQRRIHIGELPEPPDLDFDDPDYRRAEEHYDSCFINHFYLHEQFVSRAGFWDRLWFAFTRQARYTYVEWIDPEDYEDDEIPA